MFATFNYIGELQMTLNQARAASHQGQWNYPACRP